MKTWMKILLWLGIGGGIGFFAGYQAGSKNSESSYKDGYADAIEANARAWRELNEMRNIESSIKEYGGDYDGDSVTVIPDDDPPMVEDPPVIGDEEDIEEIPELHPQHMIPELITEEEYYENRWNYNQESLIYYELDEVLYNKETRSALKNKDEQDQIVGIGMLFNFYMRDGETLDAIFVKNDTMGVIFRIDRIEEAYSDEMYGGNGPEYAEEDQD